MRVHKRGPHEKQPLNKEETKLRRRTFGAPPEGFNKFRSCGKSRSRDFTSAFGWDCAPWELNEFWCEGGVGSGREERSWNDV